MIVLAVSTIGTTIVGINALTLSNAKTKLIVHSALEGSMTGMITAGMTALIPALARRLLGAATHTGIKLS